MPGLFKDQNDIDFTRFIRQDLHYGFILVDIDGKPISGLPATVVNPTVLALNPQSIAQSEPYATVLTPQQDSGMVVESRGQVMKDITISGTTGLTPTQSNLLDPQARFNELAKNSGYVQFLYLRNLFRFYGEIKRTNTPVGTSKAVDVQMVFFNEIDNDFWVVEPRNFTMNRAVPRKTLRNYTITLTAIAKYEAQQLLLDILSPPGDPRTILSEVVAASQQMQACIATVNQEAAIAAGSIEKDAQALTVLVNAVTPPMNSFTSGITSALGVAQGALRSVVSTIFNLFDDANTAGSLLSDTTATSLYQTLHSVTKILIRSALFGRSFPDEWNDIKSRMQDLAQLETLTGTSRSSMSGIREEQVMKGEDIVGFALRTLGDASRFLDVVVLNKLKPPYIVASDSNRPDGTVAPGDSLLVPVNTPTEFSSNPISVAVESTQQAPTLSGTASSATSTTLVDNLQSFYAGQWVGFTVEITGGTGAGQEALITASVDATLTIAKSWSVVPDGTSTYEIFLNPIPAPEVSGADVSFGVDLQLAGDNDLVATPASDLLLVKGVPNLSQATTLKFETEPKQLPLHTDYGFDPGIGTKATLDRILSARFNARRTFLTDARVDSVESITVSFSGGYLQINSKLRVKGVSLPQIVDLRLPAP